MRPFIVFGDGPRFPTGLARIARDLTRRLVEEAGALGISVLQVGIDGTDGLHWREWPFCGFQPNPKDQGRGAVEEAIELCQRTLAQRPVILAVTDPHRLFDLTRQDEQEHSLLDDAEIWSYTPIDAHSLNGGFGGPAAEALHDVDRVLAYGRFGADVIKQALTGYATQPQGIGQYLPHGIDLQVFAPDAKFDPVDQPFLQWAQGDDTLIIGCVATNQPRKDLGVLFATVQQIRERGYPVQLWLHTDEISATAWDISELATVTGCRPADVFVSIPPLPDAVLAARYALSDVTIAPGLGEGFGYPIVESLACGTPVVHGNYGGGAELLPDPRLLVEPAGWRMEGTYALLRPLYKPAEMADKVLEAVTWARGMPGATSAAYFAGSVRHLGWDVLWPRWRSWIHTGLVQLSRRAGTAQEAGV